MSNDAPQNDRVRDQFSQQAEAYAALVKRAAESARDPLIELLEPTGAERVLDVGCGSGQFVVAVSRYAAHAVGADLTPAMLDKARAHQAEAGVANVEWLLADSVALPVADASFDIVTSRSMLHHAADAEATLTEMRRACAPGGRIAVLDLTPAPDKAPAFDAIELLRDPSHARTYTTEQLRGLGGALGLEEVAVRTRQTSLPVEATLGASFPEPGMRERVRALYARDAATGGDAFGLKARLQDGQVWITYPMTMIVWRRP